MDLVIAETQDNMINSLQFGLPESAAYITDRKQVHFPSVSGNIFSSKNGNKYIKFVITGEDNNYIDMSSICLFFDVVNTSETAGQYLRPLGESHAFFTRYRCNAAGQQINDIDNYNLVCEEMKSFKSEEVRNLDDIQEGCLTRYDSRINRLYAFAIEGHMMPPLLLVEMIEELFYQNLQELTRQELSKENSCGCGHKPVLRVRSIWVLSSYSILSVRIYF